MWNSTRLAPGRVKRSEDWRWSSARAHLGLASDGITDVRPLLDEVPDWRLLLDSGFDDQECGLIRSRERTGYPLGDAAFLEELAGRSGRSVQPKPRGRPPRQPHPPFK